MLTYEQDAWAEGCQRLAGVDEAGRGPLAGPVVAAAVLMDRAFLEREQHGLLAPVNDSKKLTAARREELSDLLTGRPEVLFATAAVEPPEIDALNILRATHTAMARCLEALHPPSDLALIDGLPVQGLPCKSRNVIKGDGKSLLIAAASILAKVERDRIMESLDLQYPQYGFKQHKGYGTRAHLEALRAHGPCPAHRRSFAPVRACFEPDPQGELPL